MRTKRKKILVLSELKKDLDSTLSSAVSLAKTLDAEVELFYVKKPTDIVNKESQLSAIRTINREQVDVAKQLNKKLDPYRKKWAINIASNFSFGNVKSEIENYIRKTKPDILILGKRKSKLLKLGGDKITDYILSTFQGPVLIVSRNRVLEPQKNISLGTLNNHVGSDNSKTLLSKILAHSNGTPKSFKIVNKTADNYEALSNGNPNEYIFERNDNTVKNISNYLVKSKINLLYLNRTDDNSQKQKSGLISYREIINNIDVPLLFGNLSGLGFN